MPLQPLPESLQLHLLEMYVFVILYNSLYVRAPRVHTWHKSDILPLKVSHAGAHTEVPLASTMQARSTYIVRLVQSILLILYLAG